jgi:hypothetical protein
VTIFVKDPGATIDYAVDWSAGYLAGQNVTESSWTVAPAEAGGVAVEASMVMPGKTVVTLAGGKAGHQYRITNRVRFSDSRSDERTLVVRVEER